MYNTETASRQCKWYSWGLKVVIIRLPKRYIRALLVSLLFRTGTRRFDSEALHKQVRQAK